MRIKNYLLALCFFVFLALILPIQPISAARETKTINFNVCLNIPTNDPLADSAKYTMGDSDKSIGVALYKTKELASNLLGQTRITNPASNESNCKVIYQGSVLATFDTTRDKPIIIRAEIPVKQAGATTYQFLTQSATFPSYQFLATMGDIRIDFNQGKSALKPYSSSLLFNKAWSASMGGFRLFPDLSCTNDTALNCFVGRVWNFSQTAVLLLAVAAVVIAGVIYMTSAGSPKQIEMAKKIIIGALTAVAVIILGRFFLTNVVGVPWL